MTSSLKHERQHLSLILASDQGDLGKKKMRMHCEPSMQVRNDDPDHPQTLIPLFDTVLEVANLNFD